MLHTVEEESDEPLEGNQVQLVVVFFHVRHEFWKLFR